MKTCLHLTFRFLLLCLNPKEVYSIDNLSAQTNDYLVQKIDSFQFDKNNPKVWRYINAYILKAKIRKDNETLFYAYKEGIYFSNDYHTKVKYADSTIVIAQKTRVNDLLIQSYLSKGMVHYQYKKFQPALQNYLLAEKKLNSKSSKYLYHKVIFNLALIKFHLKQLNEAYILFQRCSSYFEKNASDTNHQTYYLNTLYYITSILQSQQKFDLARQLSHDGIKLSKQMQDSHFIHYFSYLSAIDKYFEKDYKNTISILTKEIHYLEKQQDFNTLSKVYFYIGKSFEKLNDYEKLIEYFQKVDKIFNQNEFLDIEMRPVYESLINYSEKKSHYKDELYYINQLLKLDQLIHQNFEKLSPVILKEYDVKELLKLKKELEFKLYFYPILVFSVILISFIGLYYIYTHFFKNKSVHKNKLIDPQNMDIPTEVVLEILIKLDEFELNKLFLQPTLTLTQLAKTFKTNTAYLSRIINTQKGTNFSNYINQLRINYIMSLLENNENYHKHSIKDLSELGVFSSARHFSDAFFQVTSKRPNDFIKQLKHRIKLNELKNRNS
ncbi:AraC family transcriptional regulator [Chishuiella sp.]|uniref:AraC family transcriptional regulator n=1 Tax=Chishuiella sp. TaxID=1969467 RepID=UPI0028A92266|nr:AraC family transcriptional regulator [Chishuiella sp.]